MKVIGPNAGLCDPLGSESPDLGKPLMACLGARVRVLGMSHNRMSIPRVIQH